MMPRRLARHRDHLALIDETIAVTEASIRTQQDDIRRMLAEGGDIVREANIMRANQATLNRLRSDRAATLNAIGKYDVH
jgi:hypothetical protein